LEAKCCGYVVEYEFMHQQLETINSNEQWILLAKQINHCKVKITCCISWAFYAPSKSFSPKMNSSFNLTSQELLKFVICYFIVSLASLKKGLITYWSINGIFSFREHHNLCFFGYVHYNKNDIHKKQFEKNLVLFIVKEFVLLSFVEVFL
jgi:hypothetical protein